MNKLLGLFHFGILMWMGGLITALRLLILHPKESLESRPRFLYLEKGFFNYTALPGIAITAVTGCLLAVRHGAGLAELPPPGWITPAALLLMAAIHLVAALQFRAFARLPTDEQDRVRPFAVEHKLMLLLVIVALVFE